MLKGYSGYYLQGAIIQDEKGNKTFIPFSYRALGRIKRAESQLMGVESVAIVEQIEVMGDYNPFCRMQVLALKNGEYMVISCSEIMFTQLGKTLVINLEVQKN